MSLYSISNGMVYPQFTGGVGKKDKKTERRCEKCNTLIYFNISMNKQQTRAGADGVETVEWTGDSGENVQCCNRGNNGTWFEVKQ